MLTPIDTVRSLVRSVRPPAVLNHCPVCGRPVTERDRRWRLWGDTFAHRDCCTYRVRRVAEMGGYRPSRRRLDDR
jgi:hypothetical protein